MPRLKANLPSYCFWQPPLLRCTRSMDVYPLHRYSEDALSKLLDSIAFFKKVKNLDPRQFSVLMSCSHIREYRVGEVLIESGQHDSLFYFLLKGQLAVYAGGHKKEMRRVGDITPGEVFGDLAVLLDHRRTATVIADIRYRRNLVFCTDFSVFGELGDFSIISLSTKLVYYRVMVHNLRWKLEMYRSQYPGLSFASNHHKVRLYAGPLDTQQELESLDLQARQLSEMLLGWNRQLVSDA